MSNLQNYQPEKDLLKRVISILIASIIGFVALIIIIILIELLFSFEKAISLVIQFSIFIFAFLIDSLINRKKMTIEKIIRESMMIGFLTITLINFFVVLAKNQHIKEEIFNYMILRGQKKELEMRRQFGMELKNQGNNQDIWGNNIVYIKSKDEMGRNIILIMSPGPDRTLNTSDDQIITSYVE